jgi:CDP-diacylglycerol--inositol 3-phosphatidyltransferase
LAFFRIAMAVTRSKSRDPRKVGGKNVFLFIPNLIGYCRIILLIISILYSFKNFQIYILSYSLSALLDLFDGMAARHFNQVSKLGAVLDMVTDRISTNSLYLILALIYSNYSQYFCLLALLDYSSHWCQMYASAVNGSHHKVLDSDRNWLLRFYYSNKVFMFSNCLSQELFLIALYCYNFAPVTPVYYLILVCSPMNAVKQLINLIQLIDAAKQIAKRDLIEMQN